MVVEAKNKDVLLLKVDVDQSTNIESGYIKLKGSRGEKAESVLACL